MQGYPAGMDARVVLSVFVGGVLVIVGLMLAVVVASVVDVGGVVAASVVVLLVLLLEAGVAVAVMRARQARRPGSRPSPAP